ncbi:hypothetical protein NPIL_226301 [Nephila pilipes]|uniref:Uncharacterized protein n=1 Tax=Nephila pilipes TaxID=299642 RepID=A0A8X6QN48_NEPPI|nr:hypothetical protein NPIL_226301 [Nephila pilipes]
MLQPDHPAVKVIVRHDRPEKLHAPVSTFREECRGVIITIASANICLSSPIRFGYFSSSDRLRLFVPSIMSYS